MATAEIRISVLDVEAAKLSLEALATIADGCKDAQVVASDALETISSLSARAA